MASVKKETIERLHKYCQRGEKHNNLINRMIEVCEEEKIEINLSDETVSKLFEFTGGDDLDEALTILVDKFRVKKR